MAAATVLWIEMVAGGSRRDRDGQSSWNRSSSGLLMPLDRMPLLKR